jgi:uncharacterized protein YcnI
MRFSAWSLRAISVCSALVFTGSAWAHVSVTPTRVASGEAVDLTVAAPNEDDALGVDHVTIRAPEGFALDDGEAKPGWTQSRSGNAITWTGGNIPKGEFATFVIRGDAPKRTGTITFDVLVGDRTGKSITYRLGLDVASSKTEDPSARSLGKVALGVALGAALLALAALFLGLYVWLRPPPA